MAMNANYNLPPNVTLSDVDGSKECPECDGAGVTEDSQEECSACEGTGLKISHEP